MGIPELPRGENANKTHDFKLKSPTLPSTPKSHLQHNSTTASVGLQNILGDCLSSSDWSKGDDDNA